MKLSSYFSHALFLTGSAFVMLTLNSHADSGGSFQGTNVVGFEDDAPEAPLWTGDFRVFEAYTPSTDGALVKFLFIEDLITGRVEQLTNVPDREDAPVLLGRRGSPGKDIQSLVPVAEISFRGQVLQLGIELSGRLPADELQQGDGFESLRRPELRTPDSELNRQTEELLLQKALQRSRGLNRE